MKAQARRILITIAASLFLFWLIHTLSPNRWRAPATQRVPAGRQVQTTTTGTEANG